jgi:putative metallohydrolase (TIGR04338 family)
MTRPRDTQRSKVWRAEEEVAHSPLPGLPACATFADRVVGSLWWAARFPDHSPAPRWRPGYGARTAFFALIDGEPTITLPRRYRTKGVVLHELAHWVLDDLGVANHGPTFTRLVLDLTAEFVGPERVAALAASYQQHRVKIGAPAERDESGNLVYGAEELAVLADRYKRSTTMAMP